MILSPMQILGANALLEELIDPHTGWWNVELVKNVFNDVDSSAILRISVSALAASDKLIWRGTSRNSL